MDEGRTEDDADMEMAMIDEVEIDVEFDERQNQIINELKRRCAAAEIEVSERRYEDGQVFVSILLPSGREKRAVPASGGRAEALLRIEFEKYVFLRGYDAICSYRDQSIEAVVRGYPIPPALARFLESLQSDQAPQELLTLTDATDQAAPVISLGRPTAEIVTLLGARYVGSMMSLKISGGGFTNQEEAVALLKKLANSLGFQMEMTHGVGFSLVQERRRRFIPRRRRPIDQIAIEYPKHEYETAPISLYWYARDARGLPLLRFLALYQCIEYFFPTYSEAEAKRRIGIILKDPAFRSDRDSDIARILTAIKISRSGFGNEKSQLKAVFDACVDPDELRTFIDVAPELREHLIGKGRRFGFHKIPVANESLDLRSDVAERIYDIRCKIVHTKDEEHPEGKGMILPFSDEAESLELDNVLLEFVAQKVIIGSSVPIRFAV